jgi:hypothetical protein
MAETLDDKNPIEEQLNNITIQTMKDLKELVNQVKEGTFFAGKK